MATASESKISSVDTEETCGVICTSCSDNGDTSTAGHYCVDCELYMCVKCLKYHKTFPATKSHQVNDVEYSDQTVQPKPKKRLERESSEKLRCHVHHGKIMDIFCIDHEEICCGTCVVLKHRICKTKTVQDAAKDFKSCDEIKQYDESLKEILAELDLELEKRTENLLSIEQNKIVMLERVDEAEEDIISWVKNLAEASRTQIRDTYEDHKQVIDSDVDVLRDVIATATECVDKLKLTNEEQLFTNVQTGKSTVKEMICFLQSMSSEWSERGITFTIDQELKIHIAERESLGVVEDIYVQKYKAVPYTKINISTESTNEKHRIFDMCIMESGSIVLTDTDRNKLRRYSPEFRLVDSIGVLAYPVAVCTVEPLFVASRSFDSGRVQLISVQDTMEVKSSFLVESKGHGMTYDASKQVFIVCENQKVSVYSKTGTKLRTFEKTSTGETIFEKCKQITVDVKLQRIYVSDWTKGFVVLDKHGDVIPSKEDWKGTSPWALCKLPGQLFVISNRSPNTSILQFEFQGHSSVLLDVGEGLPGIYTAVYDHMRKRLIVSGDSSTVHVYSLCAINTRRDSNA